MFKNLSYKKRNRILIGVSIFFAFIIYEAAIKKTISVYSNYKNLEQRVQIANDAPEKMKKLKLKDTQMDIALGYNNINEDVQQSILGIITDYCNKNSLTIEEFPSPISEKNNGVAIETNIFTIGGGFNKVLNLIYLLDQKYKVGKVVSVDYKMKRDNMKGSSKLNVTIYLQNIKRQSHET